MDFSERLGQVIYATWGFKATGNLEKRVSLFLVLLGHLTNLKLLIFATESIRFICMSVISEVLRFFSRVVCV